MISLGLHLRIVAAGDLQRLLRWPAVDGRADDTHPEQETLLRSLEPDKEMTGIINPRERLEEKA